MSIPNTDYVICEVCHRKFRQITLPHLKSHDMTISEYCIKFPDVVLACSDMAQKRRETNLNRRGVEYDFQSENVKDKIKRTNLERYGVENPMQRKEIRDKTNTTVFDRYGVENPMQSRDVQDKAKRTLFEHYGVESPMQSKEIQDRRVDTCIEKYGTRNFMQDKGIQSKKRSTNLERYGVEHVLQNEEFKIKLSCSVQGINREDFNGFISYDPYCEKFNKVKKKEVRNKYNNCDYLTGIHRDICNRDKSGKVRELDVHHVDFNKMQGCKGHEWLLIPVSRRHNGMFNRDRPFWERLIKYALRYDKEYYNGVI